MALILGPRHLHLTERCFPGFFWALASAVNQPDGTACQVFDPTYVYSVHTSYYFRHLGFQGYLLHVAILSGQISIDVKALIPPRLHLFCSMDASRQQALTPFCLASPFSQSATLSLRRPLACHSSGAIIQSCIVLSGYPAPSSASNRQRGDETEARSWADSCPHRVSRLHTRQRHSLDATTGYAADFRTLVCHRQ